MKKRVLCLAMALLMAGTLLTGCGTTASEKPTQTPAAETTEAAQEPATRTVVDLAGRTVTIPADVTKVAPLVGPGYEKVILLGGVDKVVITGNKMATSGWATVVAPEYADVPVTESATDPNIEELVSLGVQVVFYWDAYPEVIEKMEAAGIAVVVTQLEDNDLSTVEDFVALQKQEVLLFGEVLGDEAYAKAQKWCDYFDEQVDFVTSRVATLSEGQYPSVYYVRGPEALSIHGGNSYTARLVEMAGGDLVSKNDNVGLYTTTMESVVQWNPEYIFMGRVNNIELITEDPAWSSIKAVQDGNIYVNPKGVMVWDYSSEGFLLMDFVAKTLHPDLFADMDVIEQIKEYYSEFYGYDLTTDQATLIYNFKTPDGQ